jgi:hypothetical protein
MADFALRRNAQRTRTRQAGLQISRHSITTLDNSASPAAGKLESEPELADGNKMERVGR